MLHYLCFTSLLVLYPPPPNTHPSRKWDEQTLSDAYTQLLDEISLSPSHPGGQVEFRRSLTLSLLFKFNLQMLHKLWEMVWTGSLFTPIGSLLGKLEIWNFYLLMFLEI